MSEMNEFGELNPDTLRALLSGFLAGKSPEYVAAIEPFMFWIEVNGSKLWEAYQSGDALTCANVLNELPEYIYPSFVAALHHTAHMTASIVGVLPRPGCERRGRWSLGPAKFEPEFPSMIGGEETEA